MKETNYDPKQQYLIQDGSGAIYVRTERLAKRKDMRPFDPESGRAAIVQAQAQANLVALELQGRTFKVEPALQAMVADLLAFAAGGKEQLAALEAQNVRLDTDNTDLQAQLTQAQAQIAELMLQIATPAPPPAGAGGTGVGQPGPAPKSKAK